MSQSIEGKRILVSTLVAGLGSGVAFLADRIGASARSRHPDKCAIQAALNSRRVFPLSKRRVSGKRGRDPTYILSKGANGPPARACADQPQLGYRAMVIYAHGAFLAYKLGQKIFVFAQAT